ncbi:MAG: hypothetical protein EB028_05745, partial [Actinobacteria bacterium]|nr:hypothetical protein [Actinomycetota bacterium]
VASNNGLGSCTSSYEYESAGLELVENSPSEILHATYELLNRHQEDSPQYAESQELVAKFWSLYYQLKPAPIKSFVEGQEPNIGSHFLKNNLHWTG